MSNELSFPRFPPLELLARNLAADQTRQPKHRFVRSKARVDITPPINGEQRILFLPDPTQTYDFASQKRRINIKRNSGVFSSVDGWIAAADRLQQAIEDNSTGNQVTLERSYLSALGRDIQDSLAAVFVDLARATRPNDPCFCTSGKKFKKCCGPLVQLYP